MNSTQPAVVVHARPWWRTVAAGAGDALWAAGLVLCLPIVILAIGAPIALAVRALLWIVGIR